MSSSSSIQALVNATKAVNETTLSPSERQDLLQASVELQSKLERPWDTIFRLVYRYPALASSLKTLVDLRLFEKWVAAGAGPKTCSELSTLVDADEALIVRLLRVVAAEGLASVPAPHTYEMNHFTRSLALAPQSSPIEYLWFFNLPAFLALPQYLSAHRYKNPSHGPANTPFNWGLNASGTLFDHRAGRPREQESFANCMIGYAGSMAPWTDIFPTEQLLQGAGTDQALVVDVGGGVGHDLVHMHKKHGLGAGLLVLQDQGDVVAHAEPNGAFTAQAHNFFDAQPVQGARAYYMHSIMHDWPDEECVVILGRIRDAMGPESRVLVHDIVLQAQHNSAIAAQSDVMMMVAFNSLERTEQMWEALVTRVGLKIVQIHSSKASPQSVIELSLR